MSDAIKRPFNVVANTLSRSNLRDCWVCNVIFGCLYYLAAVLSVRGLDCHGTMKSGPKCEGALASTGMNSVHLLSRMARQWRRGMCRLAHQPQHNKSDAQWTYVSYRLSPHKSWWRRPHEPAAFPLLCFDKTLAVWACTKRSCCAPPKVLVMTESFRRM